MAAFFLYFVFGIERWDYTNKLEQVLRSDLGISEIRT